MKDNPRDEARNQIAHLSIKIAALKTATGAAEQELKEAIQKYELLILEGDSK